MLRSSLWVNDSGRYYMKRPLGDGSVTETVWLDKVVQTPVPCFLQLHRGGSGPASEIECQRYATHPSLCRLFWAVRSFQAFLAYEDKVSQGTRWIARSMPVWMKFLTSLGVPANHIIKPFAAANTPESAQHVMWLASTWALLLILVRLAAEKNKPHERAKTTQTLDLWLSATLPSKLTFRLNAGALATPTSLHDTGIEVTVVDGKVQFLPDARVLKPSLLDSTLVIFLAHLYKHRTSHAWMLSQACASLAFYVDEHEKDVQLSPTPPVGAPTRKRRRVDPTLRVQQRQLLAEGGRTMGNVSTVAKLLKVNRPLHYSAVDGNHCRKYYFQCYGLVSGSQNLAVTLDKARAGAGKNWLATACYSPDSKRVCWLAPQA
eukprot:2263526-Amphidinium_carterae.2